MKSSSKIAIALAVIIIAMPLIVVLAAEVILNSASVKSEIERAVAEALEMEFEIEGRIDIRFWPLFDLAADNLIFRIKSGQIASAERIVIDPRLIPLLSLDVQIKKASLRNARLNFNPGAINKILALVHAEPSDEPLPVKSLTIESFSISKGAFAYTDKQTRIDVNEMDFRGGRLEIIDNHNAIIDDIYKLFNALDFTGDIKARRIATDDFKLDNLRAELTGKNGRLTADPAQAQYLGSTSRLNASLDLIKPHSKFTSSLAISGLDMTAMAADYFPAVNIHGKVDITTGITASGIELEPLIDYLSTADRAAGTQKIPIKSAVVEAFTLTAKELNYGNDGLTIDQAGLKLKGDRWAVIDKNRGTLTDFFSFLRATKINGNTTIKRITLPDQLFENLRATLSNDHGVFRSDPIELEYFGEQARIGWAWDLRTEDIETIHLRVDMPDLDTGRFFKRSEGEDTLQGKLNIHANLITRGIYGSTMLKNLNGRVYLKGTNLTLKKVDFDRALDEFKKMGAYGFGDFAALVTLGPLGAMVSNGYDQLDALEKMMAAEGDGTIQKIISDWSVIKGIALAGDVAFSTKRHRVAIAGKLDFPNRRLDKLTIAVVDSNGCIVNKETLDGPFKSPEVKDTGVVQRTVIRPLKRMLKSDCVAFYDGSVAHPVAASK
jgi:uncharacterized protein involved in outer membrane biogenesis